MDTDCVQVKFPEYIKQMFRRIRSILSLQVYELPELTSIATNPRLNDDAKFVLLRKIFDEFNNRYGVNVSIYEFCRFRNVRIPRQFADIPGYNPQMHTEDILSMMLDERIHTLEEMAKVATYEDEKIFIQKNPTKTKSSRKYWTFNNTKELRNYKLYTENYHIDQELMEEEEKDEEEDEDFEIINEAEHKLEEEEIEKDEEKTPTEIIRIQTRQHKYSYRKRKRKINSKFENTIRELNKLNEEEEEENEEEELEIKSKYKKVENLFEDRYWNTIVDLNIVNNKWINVFYRSCKYDKIPDIRIDALIGEVTAEDEAHFINGIFILGKIRNMICSRNSIVDIKELCDQEIPEPDILIESKYWKLLRFKTKLENEPLKLRFQLEVSNWMELKYQKLDMEF